MILPLTKSHNPNPEAPPAKAVGSGGRVKTFFFSTITKGEAQRLPDFNKRL